MNPPTRKIVKLVAADCFPGTEPEEIMAFLDLYGIEPYERERERVHLAILKLSEGDLNRMLYYIDIAKIDYRDVLLFAEFMRPWEGGD